MFGVASPVVVTDPLWIRPNVLLGFVPCVAQHLNGSTTVWSTFGPAAVCLTSWICLIFAVETPELDCEMSPKRSPLAYCEPVAAEFVASSFCVDRSSTWID